MGLMDKLFGTRSQREIKKLQPTVDKILSLEEEYKALSEEALKGKTQEFKDRLSAGESAPGEAISGGNGDQEGQKYRDPRKENRILKPNADVFAKNHRFVVFQSKVFGNEGKVGT